MADAMLQSRQDLRDRIIPPCPLAQIHTSVQFIPRLPEAAAPPPVFNQSISAKYRWGDTLNSLLRLCNVTASADLTLIWDVISSLSRERYILTMEAACLWID